MDYDNDSDLEVIDEILGPEDLFNDEAEEGGGDEQNDDQEEPQDIQEDKNKEKEETKPKLTRTVLSKRATLNYNTLKGENGLNTLKNLFKNFKFKGNGHEKEDLIKIMGILQQWMCFKLCPSYDFESCMLNLEALSNKRNIKVLMKKFRLGMDEWGENPVEEKNENGENKEVHEITENTSKTAFDILLEEEMAKVGSDDDLNDGVEEMPIQNENQQNMQMDIEVTLTPEQLERIARNKKLAEERRLKRMSEKNEAMEVNTTGDQEISLERINLEENCL